MREYKFKVGDIVIGNEIANQMYSVTSKGFTGKVLSLSSSTFVISDRGSEYRVVYDAFDLVYPHNEKPNNTEVNNYEIF